MSLIEKIEQKQHEWKTEQEQCRLESLQFIAAVALRELHYETLESDAVSMVDALDDCGLELDDYRDLLKVIPNIARKYEQLDEFRKLQAEHKEYRGRLLRVEQRAKAEIEKARRELGDRNRQRQISDHLTALEDYAARFPALFESDTKGDPKPVADVLRLPNSKPRKSRVWKTCAFCGGPFIERGSDKYCGHACIEGAKQYGDLPGDETNDDDGIPASQSDQEAVPRGQCNKGSCGHRKDDLPPGQSRVEAED